MPQEAGALCVPCEGRGSQAALRPYDPLAAGKGRAVTLKEVSNQNGFLQGELNSSRNRSGKEVGPWSENRAQDRGPRKAGSLWQTNECQRGKVYLISKLIFTLCVCLC